MEKDKSQPFVLYIAEKIYFHIFEIKKKEPNISNIEAIERFIGTEFYDEISSGKFHEKWLSELKENKLNIIERVKKNGKKMFFIGGSLDYLTYMIVVWAFTKAPIPMVGALRESSIFFSIFIGYFFLKEKITPAKILSIILILAGVIGLKIF